MRWSVWRAMLAVLMLIAVSAAPVAAAHAQEANFKETLKAAEQGDSDAQCNLGLMYDQGKGVAQDYGKARAWYQKAAEQGLAEAQLSLGIMYAQGWGGRKDDVQAYKWMALSAERGMRGTLGAAKLLVLIARAMTPAELAGAKRLVAEWKRKNAGQDGQ